MSTLTVKHISIGGTEMIIPAVRVWAYPVEEPGDHRNPARMHPKAGVSAVRPDGASEDLSGGTVFVMNANGSTVARYDLGASMVPPGEDGATAKVLAA